jgi:hypothetical protein
VLISFAVISAVFADLILLPVLLLVIKPLGREPRGNNGLHRKGAAVSGAET